MQINNLEGLLENTNPTNPLTDAHKNSPKFERAFKEVHFNFLVLQKAVLKKLYKALACHG